MNRGRRTEVPARRESEASVIATIYVRKSTERNGVGDEEKSVTRQVEHAKAYAAKTGWTVAEDHVYVDRALASRLPVVRHEDCASTPSARVSRCPPNSVTVGRMEFLTGTGAVSRPCGRATQRRQGRS